MGKYIRNHKTHKESKPLMDVSSSASSLGVLTRAKSLALQQQQKPSSSSLPTSPNPPRNRTQKQNKKTTTDCLSVGGGSYLQLRSRRLQKKPPIVLIRRNRRKDTCVGRGGRRTNPNPQIRDGSRSDSDLCIETSFGENFSNESLNRTTRESTPCSLIRKVESVTTPGSSTRVGSDESNRRGEGLSNLHLPTTPEMDEFFSGAEEEQQKQFIDKYNFDPVNEQPLPGRYEWKKVDD